MNKLIFETSLQILINHINYGNHLGHDSLLSILQECRIKWIKSIDINSNEKDISENIGWLVRRIEVDYLSEGFHGDKLNIKMFSDEIGKSKFNITHVILNETRNKVLAKATITLVCFNFESNRISKIPNILSNEISSSNCIAESSTH